MAQPHRESFRALGCYWTRCGCFGEHCYCCCPTNLCARGMYGACISSFLAGLFVIIIVPWLMMWYSVIVETQSGDEAVENMKHSLGDVHLSGLIVFVLFGSTLFGMFVAVCCCGETWYKSRRRDEKDEDLRQ